MHHHNLLLREKCSSYKTHAQRVPCKLMIIMVSFQFPENTIAFSRLCLSKNYTACEKQMRMIADVLEWCWGSAGSARLNRGALCSFIERKQERLDVCFCFYYWPGIKHCHGVTNHPSGITNPCRSAGSTWQVIIEMEHVIESWQL